MIRTLAIQQDGKVQLNVPIEQLKNPQIAWYWIDFNAPSAEESSILANHFNFHPLAIEDCLYELQRPKLDYYEGYQFLVLHSLQTLHLKPEEIDLFINDHFIISYHQTELQEVDQTWDRTVKQSDLLEKGPIYLMYKLIDRLVSAYFPFVQQIEDDLELIEYEQDQSAQYLIDQIFQIRNDLSKLRRSVIPMNELLYRINNSEYIIQKEEHKIYFHDIYNHLIKLSHMIDASREITADIRDNYLSLNSYRMNKVMVTLTVITTIFMPLTFIAGVYGMNFDYMPELKWHYGYFIVLGLMILIGIVMFFWFKMQGWFDHKR